MTSAPSTGSTSRRRSSVERVVAIVVFDGVQPLDVVGPHEVFAGANSVLAQRGSDDPRYRLVTVGVRRGPVTSESGLQLVAAASIAALEPSSIDTVLLPGGDGVLAASSDCALVSWVAQTAGHARRTVTVCSGTFLAAAAGLIDGRRVTTHWARGAQLASRYPDADVDVDPIYVRDGKLWTSAGVTAGIDLALALVEHDLGVDVAQIVARWLVVFLRRPGGQSQFATPVWTQPAEREPIQAAQALVHGEPGADWSVAVLASRVGLSPRHFTRLFQRDIGVSPARYVERVRVDVARRLLESERAGVATIASRCGFGTAETMRRAFLRHVGVAPDHYRQRFSLADHPLITTTIAATA
jgi:transcriptional regulator GlxA family with amidase domain